MIPEIHNNIILPGRKQNLIKALTKQIAGREIHSLLDVGCGDGEIASALATENNISNVSGIEVNARPKCYIPIQTYNGRDIPYADQSIDCILLCDVLHHDNNPEAVIKECKRVAKLILIKDHIADTKLARIKLRMMDWVGNRHHNVRLPYNYLSGKEWEDIFKRLGLVKDYYTQDVQLYPPVIQAIFGKNLHVITMLKTV